MPRVHDMMPPSSPLPALAFMAVVVAALASVALQVWAS